MESVSVAGNIREKLGAASASTLRKEGKIPCVIYGGKENIHFTTTHNDVKSLIYTPEFKLALISVDGNEVKCILKDLQVHPVTDQILHIDFIELVDGKALKVKVPVRFKGTSEGVKTGGKLVQRVRKVTVKTTPENLVDALYADITSLELGDAARIKDLEVPEGVQILGETATPVCTVEVPRALKSAASEEEGAVAAPVEEAAE